MLHAGQVIFLAALSLLCFGVVMVNSAGMSVAEPAVTFGQLATSRSSAYMGLALVAMAIFSRLPTRRLPDLAERLAGPRSSRRPMRGVQPLLLCSVGLVGVLATVYLPVIGHEVNGSHRWVRLGLGEGRQMNLQPSEIAKWGMIALIAWYVAIRGPAMRRVVDGLGPALIAVGLVSAVVAVEDLGTGVLIAGAAAMVLLAGGARLTYLLALAPLGLVAFAGFVLTSEYRTRRILAFLDPFADPADSGYHMIQSMVAIANGNVFGRGLGHGLQKFGYLPEDQTDFLFAVICEELGLVGATAVIALIVTLMWAIVGIVRREPSPMLRLFGVGVLATVGLQATINIAVVTGLGPTKGIALPLVSSGGTGWVLTCAALGVLMAMDREARRRDQRSVMERLNDLDDAPGFEPALVGGRGGSGVGGL